MGLASASPSLSIVLPMAFSTPGSRGGVVISSNLTLVKHRKSPRQHCLGPHSQTFASKQFVDEAVYFLSIVKLSFFEALQGKHAT